MESSEIRGFLLSLVIQESLLGIPGFRVITDTQSSHIIIKDSQENNPEVVIPLLAELNVMGVCQSVWVEVGCNDAIKFLHFWFSLEVTFLCCVLQIILEDREGFL